MRIGVDFDNTIVRYDALFHRLAVERGLLPTDTPVHKSAVRDALRALGREQDWIDLQAQAYGHRIDEATPFDGVKDFLAACRLADVTVCVISHKTARPANGDDVDLPAAARRWLRRQGFMDDPAALPQEALFFEPSKAAKLRRIATQRCDHFIDDLPEFLAEADFPPDVRRWLFDPADALASPAGVTPLRSWTQAAQCLLRPPSTPRSRMALHE